MLYPIVGTEQPTWQCGRISSGSLTMLKRYPGERLDGDGTVSRVAALPIEMGVNTGVFVPNTHSALQSCEPVLAHLRALMTGATISEQRFRSATDANHIAIDIEDSYDSSKPVEIRATTSSRRRSLVAAIERHDQPEFRVRMPLEAREDQYVANVSLAPGLYKVTMRGEGCVSVSDLFLVSTPNQ